MIRLLDKLHLNLGQQRSDFGLGFIGVAVAVADEREGLEVGEGLQLREAGVGEIESFQRKRIELGHAGERVELGIGQRFAIHGKATQRGDRFSAGNRLCCRQGVTLADGQGFQRQRAQVPVPGRRHFGTVEDDTLELFEF